LKKYIKWGVWRVAVCLSYIQDARFLKVNTKDVPLVKVIFCEKTKVKFSLYNLPLRPRGGTEE
jgi:hypothetical protein